MREIPACAGMTEEDTFLSANLALPLPLMASLDTDFISDFVCPWCWLGLKQFQAAKLSTKLTFRPYLLDPLVPREGRDYKDYMRAKFGENTDRFKPMREHLETEGPKHGITFRFAEMTRRPNTLDAHRLMRWAEGQDLALDCAEALFRAYFEDLRDIGDRTVLADIAASIGMDAALVTDLLASDSDETKVNEEIGFFRRLGVSGVPTFIYNGETAVQGAQDAATHRKIAKELSA